MVIGIDIRVLANPIKSGIEEYTENLLSNMLQLDKDIKFKLFYSSLRSKLPEYAWLGLNNVEVFKFKISNKLLFFASSISNSPKVDTLMGGVDVFFSPHFFLTSLSPNCKRVTTFHDLSYIRFPEFFSKRKNIWHRFEMKPLWQSRFSDKLIAVSGSTKNDLVRFYNIDPAKIGVIASGISDTVKRPKEDELRDFRLKNKLPDKFVLFLGKLEPRKNISGIIEAFNILKVDNQFKDIHLVIVGARGWLYGDIFKKIKDSPYSNQIFYKDQIKDEERKYYYSLAQLFIYPSFFEGFGFPPLEAMACGTPVITSSNSSLPEIARNGGMLVSVENISELSNTTKQILSDSELKKKMIQRGMEVSSSFTWDLTARKTLDLIKSVK